MKRFFSLLICLLLLLSVPVAAFADETTVTITFTGGADGAVYSAYRLLDATHDSTNDSFSYTVNSKYQNVLHTALNVGTDTEVVAALSAMEDKSTEIGAFANDVYAAIKAANSSLDADATSSNNKITGAAQGYYLIAETNLGSDADTYSLVMLDTLGGTNITVATKESAPTLEKKVLEVNDSEAADKNADLWGDVASYDIGDEVSFKLTGTLSSQYANYNNYYYCFEDTLGAGLTYTENSLQVMIDGADFTKSFTVDYKDQKLTVSANLKDITGVEISGSSKVVVTYSATLNHNAEIGNPGNPNKAILKFQNDPYWDETGTEIPSTPGQTPEDETIVYTFKVVVNKVDEENNPLSGAQFALYKYDLSATTEGKWDSVDVTDGDNGTTFTFAGLDAGKYKLSETTAPDGYTPISDLVFQIDAEYNEGNELKTISIKGEDGNPIYKYSEETEGTETTEQEVFTVNVTDGSVTTSVVNKHGAELPTTGGMGTTVLYAAGGILVLVAVVLLVTKKRMANNM